MNRSLLTAVCLWLCSGWCSGAPSAGLLTSHRRPAVDPHPMSPVATLQPGRSRGFVSQQQKKSAAAAAAVSVAPEGSGQPAADQDAADTVGFNLGLGFGLDTPLIDSLLERLLRRKQLLMAAAAAAYQGVGSWGVGGGGGGYFPAPAVVFPYGGGGGGGVGGGGGGGILPWNRPAAYPFPFVPSLNPFGGGGGGGGVGGGGWGGFGGGGIGGNGWGGGWGGFNPLFDFDDFGWKNNNAQQQTLSNIA